MRRLAGRDLTPRLTPLRWDVVGSVAYHAANKKTWVNWGMFANLKDALHIVGISSLFSAVFMMCWTFFDISTQGYFILGESHALIRCFECGLVGFSVIYALYLIVAFVKKKAAF